MFLQTGKSRHEKFADKFTDTVVTTHTSYTSPDLSIQLSYIHYDTGILDKSSEGKHIKYGTKVSYVLADIYVGDITCFQTAFAQDAYGVGYSEKLSDMSLKMKSVLAVNGDSYSNNRHQDNGTVIRNGVVYRNERTDMETCVLNWDGTYPKFLGTVCVCFTENIFYLPLAWYGLRWNIEVSYYEGKPSGRWRNTGSAVRKGSNGW